MTATISKCACGCGEVPTSFDAKTGARRTFVHGHGMRAPSVQRKANATRVRNRAEEIGERGQCEAVTLEGNRCKNPVATWGHIVGVEVLCGPHLSLQRERERNAT